MRRAHSGLAAVLVTSLAGLSSQMALAATTGLDFAGGCPSGEPTNTGLCDQGGNADVANVSAILGVNESLVTQIGEISSFPGTGPDFSVESAGGQSGTWSVSNAAITHLAFKADTYFILGKVTAGSGTWEMDPATWDLSLATCPATICTVDPAGPRAYVESDFMNPGSRTADLSNVRAFSVVPVPAAFWLFGSGVVGLIGMSRRRRAA
jgi:hypothetical protein